MGGFNSRKAIVIGICVCGQIGLSQPFVDIINTSFQGLATTYKDSSKIANTSSNSYFNSTIPIKLDSQNTFIIRLYGERLLSTRKNGTEDMAYNLYSALIPIGLQHETKNKKWKYTFLVMPKLSSDFVDKLSGYDFQLGGYGLFTYTKSNNFKIKFGLFYNKEYFGNFFVPLAAIDWKVNERFQVYGVLPNNYRMEYALYKRKLFGGLAFKSYTRTYRLSSEFNHNYVRNNEVQVKLFLEYYTTKHLVLFLEFGRTINYSPLSYIYGTKTLSGTEVLYTRIQDNFFGIAGLAYRIRFD